MKNDKSLRLLNMIVSPAVERPIMTPESTALKSRDPNIFKQQAPEKLKVVKL